MKPIKQSIPLGIFHMILGSLAFGIMTGFVKFATATMPPFEVVFIRSFLGSFMFGAMIVKEKASFLGKQRGLLLWRGIFGFVALAMNFYAISKLNLGTAVILNYTSPIFVAIIAVLFLREKISNMLWGLSLLCFVGLYLLVGPQLSANIFPIVISLASGFMAALAFTTIRLAPHDESSWTIIFYFTAVATVGSLPLLCFGFKWPNVYEWLALAGIAVTSFYGQLFITKSIREAPASVVSPFSYFCPVFAFLFGWVVWKDTMTPVMISGAGIVILSGILIYLLEKRPEPVSE